MRKTLVFGTLGILTIAFFTLWCLDIIPYTERYVTITYNHQTAISSRGIVWKKDFTYPDGVSTYSGADVLTGVVVYNIEVYSDSSDVGLLPITNGHKTDRIAMFQSVEIAMRFAENTKR